ncbi:RsmE family RNA methyltransferase [Candidatus Uhrbacteria bacterium]|nr:RsmE family RNA methyltransferase [Candidatus Uhrbacteria bacterium]
MKLHRFIGYYDVFAPELDITDQAVVHQINNVLRLKEGQKILLCDGKGREAEASILSLDKKQIYVSLERVTDLQNEPEREIVLYCSIIKKELFDLVVQKATEVGAKQIIPLLSARTVKQDVKLDRLRQIAKEAAEQSGRGVLPMIYEPMKWSTAMDHSKDNLVNLFFHTMEKGDGIPQGFKKKIGVWIGPEGGWDEEEVDEAKKANFLMAELGPLVLRAETAAIIASYLCVHGQVKNPSV